MRIFPPQIEISDDEGFTPKKDILKREEFGKGLMNLVERVEDPMVIALDGPWGSGKSTFIKMWLGHLRKNGFPVIYFDAFANDYLDDAFTAIAGEVLALAAEQSKEKAGVHYETILKKTFRAAKILARSGAKIGLKAATLNAFNEEDFKGLESLPKDIANEVSTQADAHLLKQLENHAEERLTFKNFKEALETLACDLSSQAINKIDETKTENTTNVKRPLVFVIDELDRCKPTFALDLLEKIKHFFSVNGVHFVLVTNLEQLQSSVRVCYGEKIDAQNYLQKFFHITTTLPNHNNKGDLDSFLSYIFLGFPSDDDNGRYLDQVKAQLVNLSIINGYSFRAIERIATQIALVLATTTRGRLRIAPIVAGLCVFKVVSPEMYSKAKNGLLTFKEVEEFFKFHEWNEYQSGIEYVVEKWKVCLIGELHNDSQDLSGFKESLWSHGVSDHKQIIPDICNDLIDSLNFT